MKKHLVYLIISILFIVSSILRFNYIVNSYACPHGCIPKIAFLLFLIGIIFLFISIISFFKSKKTLMEKE